MKDSVVLVVGGAGFIGSQVNQMLYQAGYKTVVFDNLTSGYRKTVLNGTLVEGDLIHQESLKDIFENYHVIAVMHFAALIDVGESVKDPAKYYLNNITGTLNLLMTMQNYQVKTFIFSSTAAIFGHPLHYLINESHPCQPINPYGETKLTVEKMLQNFEQAYGLKFCCLRYFNAAGGDPEGKIKNYQTSTPNLIPRILISLKKNEGDITINGTDYATPDGTCVRDYIHIADLGQAHIAAMEQLLAGSSSNYYNLGSGKGFSVKEVITAVETVTGKKVKVKAGARRAGDPAMLLADPSKAASELAWHPRFSLEEMIEHAWNSYPN